MHLSLVLVLSAAVPLPVAPVCSDLDEEEQMIDDILADEVVKEEITPEADPGEWAKEAQRVAPLLAIKRTNDFRDWRYLGFGHLPPCASFSSRGSPDPLKAPMSPRAIVEDRNCIQLNATR